LSFEGLKAGFDSLAKFADEFQNAQAKIGGSLESVTTLSGVATLAGVSWAAKFTPPRVVTVVRLRCAPAS
jgi:hypothetical protein